MAADTERQVYRALGPRREVGQRGAQFVHRRLVVRAWFAEEETGVALVAAEDGVRPVQEDDGGADEAGEIRPLPGGRPSPGVRPPGAGVRREVRAAAALGPLSSEPPVGPRVVAQLPFLPAAETQGQALVRREAGQGSGAGVDGQDRDRLAAVAQPRDQPAAGERGIVRVGRYKTCVTPELYERPPEPAPAGFRP